MVRLGRGALCPSLAISCQPNEAHAITLCVNVSNVPSAWQKMSDLLVGWLQVGIGALLAATIAVTSPMAYAAPFDTDTGLAPLGMSHPAVHYTKIHVLLWALAVDLNICHWCLLEAGIGFVAMCFLAAGNAFHSHSNCGWRW